MTFDEAIKHCIEQAEIQDKLSQSKWLNDIRINQCIECAADHRQLAEWLTDLKELKAANVQRVKRGKWVLFDKDCCGRAFYCSNCRKVTTTDDFENTPLEREEYYCPRCGADMRND